MELTKKHCVPCKGGIPPLTDEEEDRYLKETSAWTLMRGGTHKLTKEFKFKDFKEAMIFLNKVADIANEEDHHPNMHVYYNKVMLELYTHAINGLHENDFIVAAKVDDLK